VPENRASPQVITGKEFDLFSGACLNKLSVSKVRIVRSKGSIRLDASLPEGGTRASFRNVLIFKILLDGGQVQKKEIVSVSRTPSSKP
jgi:hypothetical protein